jgi:hypothetical protein
MLDRPSDAVYPCLSLPSPDDARPLRMSKSGHERCELVDKAVQELACAPADRTVCGNEAGLEADIRLPAHDEHAQTANNLSQMLLRKLPCRVRGAMCRWWLAIPGILTGAPQSIAFFVTLGSERLCFGVTNNKPSAAAISDLNRRRCSAGRLPDPDCKAAGHRFRQTKGESVGAQLTERGCEPAIKGFAAIAAD